MEKFLAIYRAPFTYSFDYDRHRRHTYSLYYGNYKPMPIKRFYCWLLNERLTPIDWEEVPPFYEPPQDSCLKTTRENCIQPFECVSQPDMLTTTNIYVRRTIFLFFIIFSGWYFEPKFVKYRNWHIIWRFFVRNKLMKFFILSWSFYLFSNVYINRHYQMPYN